MQKNLAFLQGHSYFTAYGQEVLQKRKLRNIQKINGWFFARRASR